MSETTIGKFTDYINTLEASKILGVSQRRVEQLCQEGKLDAIMVSRRWLIKRVSMNAYKASKEG